jgi:2,4-dienoyl-CoA reductase-like NADH-dependent reductase (Old Yellow Enzyme family)
VTRTIPQVKKVASIDALRAHLDELGEAIPTVDEPTGADGPLGQPLAITLAGQTRTVGNRFTILPMEGWDGTTDGLPTELVTRRWQRFGESGAKLIWGGEAVAVDPAGRANPHQLTAHTDAHGEALAGLRAAVVAAHTEAMGTAEDLVVGLQLTHSGRFSRPTADGMAPVIAGPHPLLDPRLPADRPVTTITDAELDELTGLFVAAAVRAQAAGFDFVDVKACHGYLGHELLGAVDRPGPFGGSFEGRTRFLRQTIEAVQAAAPGLGIGVRFSAYDFVPFRPGADRVGEPEPFEGPYRHGFGGDGTGLGIDLTEPKALLDLLAGLGVHLVNITAGSPYYVPHIQRPAWFPPSDGYQPPEDPLVGVARMIAATAELEAHRGDVAVTGSGYTYLQDWLAHVAEAVVGGGGAASVGLGRMVLSYPDLPRDVLLGAGLDRRRICRTFSDCTTAPRAGLVSGCYPLDELYKARPERLELAAVKKRLRVEAAS